MKALFRVLIFAVVLTIIAIPTMTWSGSKKPLPPPDGKAVYAYVTETDSYKGWPLWPDKGELYEGQHPHGAFLTTYVSKKAVKTIKKKRGTFRNGTIIVKENYMPNKKLAAVTVMYRVNGYDPDAGDWFWAKYKADGTVEKEGKVKGCINCHSAQIMNDWVFTGSIKKEKSDVKGGSGYGY